MESCIESVHAYLAHRRPLPCLVDIAPEVTPAAFEDGAGSVGAPLYRAARAPGDAQPDVRLLAADGERYRGLATEAARHLRCDVYLTPAGADVRYVRESSPMAGDRWDAIAVDRATGDPVRWLVVRPPDLPPGVPTWFLSVKGRLRQSDGLVTVALPDGLAFATRATFHDAALLAGRLSRSAWPVTTVAVNVSQGRFEISRFDGRPARLGGVEFARLLDASLDVIHPDVQVALTWPADGAACDALHRELRRLAEALGRTVWVPQPQGAAFALPGCREFAAVDEVGGASTWQAYPWRTDPAVRARYETDRDGRIMPVDDAAVIASPGSAPAGGLFTVGLGILADGRLGAGTRNGHHLAVGRRELRALLRQDGWAGEDLLLLAAPPVRCADVTVRHIRSLVELYGVDVWLPCPGADVWTQADGVVAADGPRGGWQVVGYGRPDDLPVDDADLPSALVRRSRPTVVGTPRRGPVRAEPAGAGPLRAVPTLGASTRAERDGGQHGVAWLPDTPVVNQRALDLYLWTPLASDRVEGWELPAADLFLLAGRDPLRLAERRRTGHLLRLFAAAETAVELDDHLAQAPAVLRQRALDAGSTHLLPVGWLARLRVTARYDLDGRGGVSARRDIDAGALAIRFEGADHGIPGLPNDVVRWPGKGQRTDARSYLTVPDGDGTRERVVHRGHLALMRTKPAIEDGQTVLEVKVRRRAAIDVPATLDALETLPVVGRMHDFVGLDLLLPAADLDLAIVTKAWRRGPRGRPVVDRLSVPLSEALSARARDHADAA